jgi:hypothetical protein
LPGEVTFREKTVRRTLGLNLRVDFMGERAISVRFA